MLNCAKSEYPGGLSPCVKQSVGPNYVLVNLKANSSLWVNKIVTKIARLF